MRERPILFSGPMVRAILDGSKTQTRRVVKPQPVSDAFSVGHYHATCIDRHGEEYPSCNEDFGIVETDGEWYIKCQYGEPGDRLWVRENGWERPERTPKMMREGADTWAPYYYDADGLDSSDAEDFRRWGFKRRPSIHMPRAASRITLEITGVRVERLQDISESDAMAEGCNRIELGPHDIGGTPVHPMTSSYAEAFRELWQSINGPESWSANPWVWVIEFRRVK